ncbi:hypothetical protein OHC33_010201 [Knufia fluminis]|uniref:Glycosyltransferase family 28 N-terminal domain-containing protein n=1 Tax=Knufia fluminis TaxID=191047 RepID=A0AAN8ENL8_9EURO|nr:hypothetical protein OHC33_010201 [Knufia fluminis]
MAQTLTPIASSSIQYHTSPVVEPPITEFPYPESRRTSRPSSRGRVDGKDSDVTLANASPSPNDEHTKETLTRSSSRPTVERPGLADGARSSNENAFRRASASADSSSDSAYSTDDGQEPQGDLDPQASGPEQGDLRARELNRARLRPWQEKKRQRFSVGNEHFRGRGKVAKDGRLNVQLNEAANTGYLAKALGSAIHGHLHPHAKQAREDGEELRKQFDEAKSTIKIPRMNVVIMVIGSRGDIQPFLKIGRILQDKYGHRVRIATHPAFRKFVQDEIGLEFFSIGGDPSELMSFMVRNPGLIPSFETLTSGEVGRRREQMYEMFNGFWRACINTTDNEKDTANLKMIGDKPPFVADAIIGNPVSFAHYHCAEKLGIPLQLVFTFPYTPTSEFPHPLANIKSSNVDREYTNYMSYPLVDLMTWQGLGDLVNRFRVKTLGLEPVSTLWAPGQLTRMRVPTTYLWSPNLVPKPKDWGPEVDVAGYVFLDLAKSYKPSDDLTKFLKRSEEDTRPIIYIGFGSIAGIKDATAFCQLIFDATVQAGVRAVVSKGWGNMGEGMDIPSDVCMVDNVPHDWLFPKLDAVVHHGGAGTTAIGLKLGKPTMIVPFFGDQPFWANMIARAEAGAREVYPLKKLTVERFATGIKQCLEPSSKENAQAIAKGMALEGDGAENAVDSFHRNLGLSGESSMRCGVFEDRVAVWQVKHTDMKLSALAADLLVENKQLSWHDLELIRHKSWADFSGPGEPITGAGGVVVGAFQEALHGMTEIHDSAKADWKRIERRRRKKKGNSITDAIVMPGQIAQQARAASKDEDGGEDARVKVNLTGEAEPIRNIASIVGDSGNARPQNPRHATTTSSLNGPAPVILAKDVGRGIGHSFKSIVLLPMDMLNAVTLGFRNAPRLYGDRTVRPAPQNIRGFRQGVRVAGKEYFFGLYDGTTGLVKIPYMDVHEDGISGLPKGVARGLGGLVLKPVAGTLGLVNYTGKGCYASLRKRFKDTEKTDRWIRRARLAQGAADIKELRDREVQEHKANGRPPAGSGRDGNLEQARSRVLTKWTTSMGRQRLEEAREREKRGMSIVHPKLSRSERASTA